MISLAIVWFLGAVAIYLRTVFGEKDRRYATATSAYTIGVAFAWPLILVILVCMLMLGFALIISDRLSVNKLEAELDAEDAELDAEEAAAASKSTKT
jgi:uncharacterized integral membrane protein